MALKMTLKLSETFDLPCNFDKAFDFFLDVLETAKCFPKVESVTDIGDGKYHWVMEKDGVGKYSTQVEYGAEYEFDRDNGVISWTPVDGIGNAISRGRAVITEKNDKVSVNFSSTMDLKLPLPGLAKPIIKPFVNREFKKITEKFKANVIKKLS